MKVTLYKPYEEAGREDLQPLDLEIKGKLVHYFTPPTTPNLDYFEYTKRFFSYEHDNRWEKAFPKLKLNTRLTISTFHYDDSHSDESTIGGKTGYVHLNLLQRFQLDWIFKKTFVQESSNLKWLAGTSIALLSALAGWYLRG